MRNLKILFLSLAFCMCLSATAQYTQVGGGGFQSYVFGPMSSVDSTPFFNRAAYIYNSASLGGLQHGDTIRSIEFMRAGSDSLRGNLSFKIYLKNTKKSNFGFDSLNWVAEARDSGLTLVYDKNPKLEVGTKPGFVRFAFNVVDYFVFDTTNGAVNLEVLVEYRQRTNQSPAMAWYNESALTVPTFSSSYESKMLSGGSADWNDSMTVRSTIIKPTIRFNHPKYRTEVELKNIYALGRLPILMGRPDSIKVLVKNIGLDTVKNHSLYLKISGANSFADTIQIDALAPYEESLFYFLSYTPVNQGNELVEIESALDGDINNNSSIFYRSVTYNVYGHTDPTRGNDGGIGFNGSSGDFVAKFYVKDSRYLNQVKVDFERNNNNFQIGVWDDDGIGGVPGTLLHLSDTFVSVAGTFILKLDPIVKVTNGYYVGVRQTGTRNVAFSFQYETPVRPHAFYFAAPAQDTNWVGFSPGYDFNFNIQPRIQVANDLSIQKIIDPQPDTLIKYSSTDSLTPKVIVANEGYVDQSNITVKGVIKDRFNREIYSSSKLVDLKSDSSKVVEFKRFSLYNIGEFTFEASVDLNIDTVKDNNSLTSTFTLYKEHDVSPDIIFEPSDGDTFEVQDEGFWPQVRVFNYGIADQINIPVELRIVSNDSVYHSQVKYVSLAGEQSVIMTFDSVYLYADGWQFCEVITSLYRDSFPSNDTNRIRLYGRTSHDVRFDAFLRPLEGESFATDISFRPFINVRNNGFLPKDSIWCKVTIEDTTGKILYSDSALKSLKQHSMGQVLLRSFTTPSDPAKLIAKGSVRITYDQQPDNNFGQVSFNVKEGRDVRINAITFPVDQNIFEAGTADSSVYGQVENVGLVDAFKVPVLIEVKGLWRDTITIDTLRSGETASVQSLKRLDFSDKGIYQVLMVNLWTQEDEYTQNDTAVLEYTVKFKNDRSIVSHVHQDEQDIYFEFENEIEVINQGIDTLYDQGIEVEVLDPALQSVFKDSIFIDTLIPDELVRLQVKPFIPVSTGLYECTSRMLELDEYPLDDQYTSSFMVYLNYDAQIDSANAPLKGSNLKVKTTYQPSVWISNVGRKAFDGPVSVSCKVYVTGDTLIYSNSTIVELDSGDIKLVEFDSSLRYPYLSEATIQFDCYHPMDRSVANDTLVNDFQFTDGLYVDYQQYGKVAVYPNPHNALLFVKTLTGLPILDVELYDLEGRLLEQYSSDGSVVVVDNQFASGTYLLKVRTQEGFVWMRVVKK